jgi:hypothetical protein
MRASVSIDDAGLTDEVIGEYVRHRREEQCHECGDQQHDKDRAAADSVCYHESKGPCAGTAYHRARTVFPVR